MAPPSGWKNGKPPTEEQSKDIRNLLISGQPFQPGSAPEHLADEIREPSKQKQQSLVRAKLSASQQSKAQTTKTKKEDDAGAPSRRRSCPAVTLQDKRASTHQEDKRASTQLDFDPLDIGLPNNENLYIENQEADEESIADELDKVLARYMEVKRGTYRWAISYKQDNNPDQITVGADDKPETKVIDIKDDDDRAEITSRRGELVLNWPVGAMLSGVSANTRSLATLVKRGAHVNGDLFDLTSALINERARRVAKRLKTNVEVYAATQDVMQTFLTALGEAGGACATPPEEPVEKALKVLRRQGWKGAENSTQEHVPRFLLLPTCLSNANVRWMDRRRASPDHWVVFVADLVNGALGPLDPLASPDGEHTSEGVAEVAEMVHLLLLRATENYAAGTRGKWGQSIGHQDSTEIGKGFTKVALRQPPGSADCGPCCLLNMELFARPGVEGKMLPLQNKAQPMPANARMRLAQTILAGHLAADQKDIPLRVGARPNTNAGQAERGKWATRGRQAAMQAAQPANMDECMDLAAEQAGQEKGESKRAASQAGLSPGGAPSSRAPPMRPETPTSMEAQRAPPSGPAATPQQLGRSGRAPYEGPSRPMRPSVTQTDDDVGMRPPQRTREDMPRAPRAEWAATTLRPMEPTEGTRPREPTKGLHRAFVPRTGIPLPDDEHRGIGPGLPESHKQALRQARFIEWEERARLLAKAHEKEIEFAEGDGVLLTTTVGGEGDDPLPRDRDTLATRQVCSAAAPCMRATCRGPCTQQPTMLLACTCCSKVMYVDYGQLGGFAGEHNQPPEYHAKGDLRSPACAVIWGAFHTAESRETALSENSAESARRVAAEVQHQKTLRKKNGEAWMQALPSGCYKGQTTAAIKVISIERPEGGTQAVRGAGPRTRVLDANRRTLAWAMQPGGAVPNRALFVARRPPASEPQPRVHTDGASTQHHNMGEPAPLPYSNSTEADFADLAEGYRPGAATSAQTIGEIMQLAQLLLNSATSQAGHAISVPPWAWEELGPGEAPGRQEALAARQARESYMDRVNELTPAILIPVLRKKAGKEATSPTDAGHWQLLICQKPDLGGTLKYYTLDTAGEDEVPPTHPAPQWAATAYSTTNNPPTQVVPAGIARYCEDRSRCGLHLCGGTLAFLAGVMPTRDARTPNEAKLKECANLLTRAGYASRAAVQAYAERPRHAGAGELLGVHARKTADLLYAAADAYLMAVGRQPSCWHPRPADVAAYTIIPHDPAEALPPTSWGTGGGDGEDATMENADDEEEAELVARLRQIQGRNDPPPPPVIGDITAPAGPPHALPPTLIFAPRQRASKSKGTPAPGGNDQPERATGADDKTSGQADDKTTHEEQGRAARAVATPPAPLNPTTQVAERPENAGPQWDDSSQGRRRAVERRCGEAKTPWTASDFPRDEERSSRAGSAAATPTGRFTSEDTAAFSGADLRGGTRILRHTADAVQENDLPWHRLHIGSTDNYDAHRKRPHGFATEHLAARLMCNAHQNPVRHGEEPRMRTIKFDEAGGEYVRLGMKHYFVPPAQDNTAQRLWPVPTDPVGWYNRAMTTASMGGDRLNETPGRAPQPPEFSDYDYRLPKNPPRGATRGSIFGAYTEHRSALPGLADWQQLGSVREGHTANLVDVIRHHFEFQIYGVANYARDAHVKGTEPPEPDSLMKPRGPRLLLAPRPLELPTYLTVKEAYEAAAAITPVRTIQEQERKEVARIADSLGADATLVPPKTETHEKRAPTRSREIGTELRITAGLMNTLGVPANVYPKPENHSIQACSQFQRDVIRWGHATCVPSLPAWINLAYDQEWRSRACTTNATVPVPPFLPPEQHERLPPASYDEEPHLLCGAPGTWKAIDGRYAIAQSIPFASLPAEGLNAAAIVPFGEAPSTDGRPPPPSHTEPRPIAAGARAWQQAVFDHARCIFAFQGVTGELRRESEDLLKERPAPDTDYLLKALRGMYTNTDGSIRWREGQRRRATTGTIPDWNRESYVRSRAAYADQDTARLVPPPLDAEPFFVSRKDTMDAAAPGRRSCAGPYGDLHHANRSPLGDTEFHTVVGVRNYTIASAHDKGNCVAALFGDDCTEHGVRKWAKNDVAFEEAACLYLARAMYQKATSPEVAAALFDDGGAGSSTTPRIRALTAGDQQRGWLVDPPLAGDAQPWDMAPLPAFSVVFPTADEACRFALGLAHGVSKGLLPGLVLSQAPIELLNDARVKVAGEIMKGILASDYVASPTLADRLTLAVSGVTVWDPQHGVEAELYLALQHGGVFFASPHNLPLSAYPTGPPGNPRAAESALPWGGLSYQEPDPRPPTDAERRPATKRGGTDPPGAAQRSRSPGMTHIYEQKQTPNSVWENDEHIRQHACDRVVRPDLLWKKGLRYPPFPVWEFYNESHLLSRATKLHRQHCHSARFMETHLGMRFLFWEEDRGMGD